MQYFDSINGYEVFILGKTFCRENRLSYPCYVCVMGDADPKDISNHECSMDDLDDLLEWCENN